MKRIFTVVLLVIIFVSICFVTGCTESESDVARYNTTIETAFGERFRFVEFSGKNTFIIYDKETKVQYLVYYGSYRAAITVLLDTDGKPLLYDGDEK